MSVSSELLAFHAQQTDKARQLYVAELSPERDAEDWRLALREARKLIADALRDSKCLADVAAALQFNGQHMLVFRSITAPPISQDQFKLACSPWSKASERKGGSCRPAAAAAAALELDRRRDSALTRWLDGSRKPTLPELKRLFASVAPLVASQQVATVRRNRMAAVQEGAVIARLIEKGWTKVPSTQKLAGKGELPAKHFMHKARFATTTRPQEVDIACGLKGTVVLAMECKVTNDETNSVKRINDVLKKSSAWHDHWGSFVKTAALLQGVIKIEDVERLLEKKVNVFWSHDLESFEKWLDGKS